MSSWAEILTAIATTLSDATGIQSTKGFDELTEGIPPTECPRLQVYPNTVEVDARTRTDRTTFKGGVKQWDLEVFVDHFARPLSYIALDFTAMVEGLDSLTDVFEDQETPPFFGIADIKAFRWSWKRMTLKYGDMLYRGGRFTLKIRIF